MHSFKRKCVSLQQEAFFSFFIFFYFSHDKFAGNFLPCIGFVCVCFFFLNSLFWALFVLLTLFTLQVLTASPGSSPGRYRPFGVQTSRLCWGPSHSLLLDCWPCASIQGSRGTHTRSPLPRWVLSDYKGVCVGGRVGGQPGRQAGMHGYKYKSYELNICLLYHAFIFSKPNYCVKPACLLNTTFMIVSHTKRNGNQMSGSNISKSIWSTDSVKWLCGKQLTFCLSFCKKFKHTGSFSKKSMEKLSSKSREPNIRRIQRNLLDCTCIMTLNEGTVNGAVCWLLYNWNVLANTQTHMVINIQALIGKENVFIN